MKKRFFIIPLILTIILGNNIINTPKEYARWLWNNIFYRSDKKIYGINDYWQTPEETLKLGTGDCEDYAILSQFILKKLGYKEVYIIVIAEKKKKSTHAVCVFKEHDKTYSVFDNNSYERIRQPSVKKAITYLYPYWKTIYYVTPNKIYYKTEIRERK